MHIHSRIKGSGIILTGLLLMPQRILAANQTAREPEMFGGGQWFLAFLSLVFVAGITYWATRFLAGRFGNLPSRHIKVAESLCLGPNRHLYLLLINQQVLLVGSSEQGITLIKEYEQPSFYEEMKLLSDQQPSLVPDKFKDFLTPLLGKPIIPMDLGDEVKLEKKVRLVESLERIRAWKNKGRG